MGDFELFLRIRQYTCTTLGPFTLLKVCNLNPKYIDIQTIFLTLYFQ